MKKFKNNLLHYTIIFTNSGYYSYFIMVLILVSYYYSTYEILLCDDGYGNSPYETYNNNAEGSRNKPVQYQPYRPGLQETSEGYRFELPAESSNPPVIRVELNGRVVYAQYLGQDYLGNSMYTYNNQNFSLDSTQIGEIEPLRSEVLNESYYQAGYWGHKDVITTKYNSKPGIWNKIKSDFKSARESASKNSSSRLDQSSSIIKDVRSSRAGHDMLRQSRRNHRSDYYNSNSRRVRRYD